MPETPHHLRNHLSKEEAFKRLALEPFSRRVISFYRYVILDHPADLRNELYAEWQALGVLGRVYLAEEGINAQVSVPEQSLADFTRLLYARPDFKDVPFKAGVEQRDDAFWKLTVKVRRQIVADGLPAHEYDVTDVGTHLTAREWNEFSGDPEAVVVDMRNGYESAIGRFDGAITPHAQTFKEELPLVKEVLKGKEDQSVMLYCTGGVRCEKASAYLRHHGFKQVYQLHGGIIDYAHQIKREGLESKFRGKNFVFDHRMSERITEDVVGQCLNCAVACDDYTNCAEPTCNRLFLQCAACHKELWGACSIECQPLVAQSKLNLATA